MPRQWILRKDVQLTPVTRLLVDYMRRQYITATELADRAGIARTTLYHHLNGEVQGMSYYLVEKLARATAPDLTLEQLLEAAGYPQAYRTAQPRSNDLDDFLAFLRADSRFPAELQAALAEDYATYTAQRQQRRRGRMIPVDAEPPTQVLPAVQSSQPSSAPAAAVRSQSDSQRADAPSVEPSTPQPVEQQTRTASRGRRDARPPRMASTRR